MASIDLTPSHVSTASGWTQLSNLISDDNTFAINPSTNTSPLYVRFYTGNHSNNLIPTDSVITGIQVFYSAKVTGLVNGFMDFNLFNSSSRTLIASSIRSTILSGSGAEVASSVGSSSNTFQLSARLVDFNSFTNGRAVGNPWFGVSVTPVSTTSRILLDQLYVRIHYTPFNYLVGSRTKFHLTRPDLGLDVTMANGVAQSTSYIERKDNGTAISNQVKSHDVNVLGDALYNIESAILASTGSVYALDLKKTYVFAVTVSALCNSADPSIDALIYGAIRNNGTTSIDSVNLTSPQRSTAPNVPNMISCLFTSAIAWVENYGVVYPLYASSTGLKFKKTTSGIDFVVGVTALGSSIGTKTDYDSYEAAVGNYQGYIGSLFTSAAASGKVYFKIFAMGRES